jgi:chaperonin GroES
MIKPQGDKLVVKLEKDNERTSGGLIIPESSRKIQTTAKVTAKGKEVKQVNVGDRVLFNVNAGLDYAIDGVEHRIIREVDCEAVL